MAKGVGVGWGKSGVWPCSGWDNTGLWAFQSTGRRLGKQLSWSPARKRLLVWHMQLDSWHYKPSRQGRDAANPATHGFWAAYTDVLLTDPPQVWISELPSPLEAMFCTRLAAGGCVSSGTQVSPHWVSHSCTHRMKGALLPRGLSLHKLSLPPPLCSTLKGRTCCSRMESLITKDPWHRILCL